MAQWVIVVASLLIFVIPGLWIAVSGVLSATVARRAGRMEPTTPSHVEAGVATVTGPAEPVVEEGTLPDPLDPLGETLAYEYRLVRLSDPDAPPGRGELLARGNAVVPFVVDDGTRVVVEPRGAELALSRDSVERVDDEPPEALVDFLEFEDVDVDFGAQGTVAVVLARLLPGDDVYVTGVVDEIDTSELEDPPGSFTCRRGGDRVPFVVADHEGAGAGTGNVGRAIFKALIGLLMFVPGVVFVVLFGL